MLHEARMNFQRTIVNQAPRFPCRGAAQFNKRPGVDAGWRVQLAFQRPWSRATQAERYVPCTCPNTARNCNGRLLMFR
jgi:hypothetical protein